MTRYLISPLALLFLLVSSLSAQTDLRVEPPFWYTQMQSNQLQLMIHGANIGRFQASVDHPGIKITKQITGDSPNYRFVYLQIDPDVKPGSFSLSLKNGDQTKTITYSLKERAKSINRNQGFSSEDVIYLLMPDRFANGNPANDTVEGMLEPARRNDPSGRHGGDIKGVQDHLDYIKNLGMTAVWLTPVFENDQTPEYKAYHGYAATDMYKIDRRFGSNEEFVAFVKACHDKGLKVIMDMIHNHIGDQHWWMKDLPFNDWVHDQSVYGNTNYRGTVASDPYASQHDTDRLVKGWFVNEMPDLNQRNQQLADYLIQNTLWWIEYSGIDGIRMDTYLYPYQDYMARWAKEVLEAYPSFNIVGESWVESVAHESYWQKDRDGENDGYNSHLPSVTDFQIHFAVRDAFNSPFGWESGIMRLYYTLSQDRLYSDPMQNVIFLDNHDINRIYSTLGENLNNLKMAYAFLMTTRGIPQVYYGTELAFKAGPGSWGDGAKRADMPGGWPGDARSVFTAEGRTPEENAMHSYVTKLTNWRKTSDAVKNGKLIHFVPEENVYVYFRYTNRERVMVIMNMNDTEATISRKKHLEMLRGYTFGLDVITGKSTNVGQDFKVPARTTTILTLK
ncbi:glycoside hydrolase family 13 protein [Roseivirga thermotolerans]|uniref:Glycosyl hydrolase n=1 Tax=Roseivirga thermotolerans TaxID=1758176 RepID=A0ABQ3ICB7_9BACT|nr:glycoside hydrolase family 13 protein [Roseivirga thermotolerans]GHE73306.1 glycosyl hydrolase [Roseivirga thermotolerans]